MKYMVLISFCLLFCFNVGAFAEGNSITLKDGSELLYIPGGQFVMGESRAKHVKPAHEVEVAGFYMGKYEVTNEQYKRFCDETKRPYPKDYRGEKVDLKREPKSPVGYISWLDAKAYAKWAGGRLATEAEWEYACRGGVYDTRYHWGDELSEEYLSYKYSSKGKTSPVGSFPPNPYGLYDMLGNVKEWVSDWFSYGYYKKSPKSNPKGPASGGDKVIKGDYFGSAKNYGCTSRDWRPQSYSMFWSGLRIAADAK